MIIILRRPNGGGGGFSSGTGGQGYGGGTGGGGSGSQGGGSGGGAIADVVFSIQGGGVALYRVSDNSRLAGPQGAQSISISPTVAADEVITEDLAIVTNEDFTGPVLIRAALMWDSRYLGGNTQSMVDLVRLVPFSGNPDLHIDLDINTHNHPKSEQRIPLVSSLSDINEEDEARELSPGGYLWVNDDNDHNTGPSHNVLDKDDTAEYQDNDLVTVHTL